MKQIVLNVEEKKYKFFMELINNFDFVTISKEDAAKKQTLKQIANGMQSAILAGKGKIKNAFSQIFFK